MTETDFSNLTINESDKEELQLLEIKKMSDYYRKIGILGKMDAPLCPELLPTSRLSALESNIMKWKGKVQLRYTVGKDKLYGTIPNLAAFIKDNIPNKPRKKYEDGRSFFAYGLNDLYNPVYSDDSSFMWAFTITFIDLNTQFSYIGCGLSVMPENFEFAAAALNLIYALNPDNWINGSVDSHDALQIEKQNYIIRYPIEVANTVSDSDKILTWVNCSVDLTKYIKDIKNHNHDDNNDYDDNHKRDDNNDDDSSYDGGKERVGGITDEKEINETYQRKIMWMIKYNIPVPEVLKDTNLSKLERWIIEKRNDDIYHEQDRYTLFITPTMPILNTDKRIYVLMLKINDKLVMSYIDNITMQRLEAAIYDIMMGPEVMGTKENNTGNKTIYICDNYFK